MPALAPGALEAIAARLDRSTPLRHGLFLLAACLAVAVIGYHWGTFDQIVHVPFLRAAADPGLYPGDGFVALRAQHYSFFWSAFVPLVGSGHLEVAVFLVHVLATYLTFWAFWVLSMTLFGRPTSALVAVLLLVFPHIGFLGFPIVEFSLLNRTFVLPFVLFALALFLRGRPVAALALLGVMYNIHLLSVNFALATLLAIAWQRRRRLAPRALLTGSLAFAIAAGPVLTWKLRDGSGLDWTLRPEWVDVYCRGLLHNICYVVDASPLVIGLSAGGAAGLALLAIARRCAPSPHHDAAVLACVWTALGVFAVETVVVRWLPVTWILQLQVTRIGLLPLVLAYVSFAHYLVVMRDRRQGPGGHATLLGATTALSTTPLLPVIAWLLLRGLRRPVARFAVVAVPLGSLALSIALALRLEAWKPGIYVHAPHDPWVDVQIWARDHSAPDALFITPPDSSVLIESDWRVHSERSSLASLSDLLEIALAPSYLQTWQPRFEAVAPGALERFRGVYFENLAITGRAYARLDDDDFRRLSCRFGTDYVVLPAERSSDLPVAYANDGYRVYDLGATACP